jgi:PEP-CTERM motif
MKFFSKCAVLTLGLAMASTVSYADTVSMTFTGTSGVSNGTDEIFPYFFSVNGSSTQTALMCVNFDNEIFQGESWDATTSPITTSSSTTAQEDAYLFSLLGDGIYSNNDIQEAAWFLSASNPSAVPITAIDPTLLLDASNAVTQADLGGSSSFDDGQFTLYTPVPGSQNPSNDGLPQSFVGVSPTPEPNSLLLLASGLFGCAGLLYRRRRAIL